ncbi:MAG TPA: serine/threonine-protein kinase [Kofleriaceae bacterium]|nr:serine/threonine-protein kinase [Kofleriaceae bacterium]
MTDEGSRTRLGRYELVRPLAQGGMADIYLAQRADSDLARQVALKVLNRERAGDPDACQMFLDEARIVAMLHHQNIASVLDVDVVDGQHYLAMELVHGVDLRELLAQAAAKQRAIPFDVAVAIIAGAAAGLDHAHRRCSPDGKPLRLVHRDVSLSNIMVGHDGCVKVVDFGIATTTIASVQTNPGVVRGKASYMSPEQCLGDPVDHRTDVFALGVVLYELTTGARCFAGKTDFDRMMAVVQGDYVAPSALVEGFPLDLEQVIRRALAVQAAARFPSAAAMVDALEQVAANHGWSRGATAIVRLMRELYGDVEAPRVAPVIEIEIEVDDAHVIEELPDVTDRALPVIPPLPQAPGRRYARGTESSELSRTPISMPLARGSEPDLGRVAGWAPAPSVADPDDEPTRGRRPLRRALRRCAA